MLDIAISKLRKPVSDFLAYRLSTHGRTIPSIRQETRRHIPHDPAQAAYSESPVWHYRIELIEYLAGELRVGTDYLGPKRRSSDFYNMVDQEIGKLRSRNIITDYMAGRKIGIFRLADTGSLTVKKPLISVWDYQNIKEASPDAGGQSLRGAFISILTQGKKNNTYKFALARALLEYCRDNPSCKAKYDIPYEYLAGKFLEYYWHQECRYRIKQDFSTEGTPKVIQAIRRIFKEGEHGSFEDMSEEVKQSGRNEILRTVFGHARSKTSLVVPKFQNMPEGSSTTLRKIFYEYDDDAKIVRLLPDAFDFFKKNHRILSMAVLAEWAKFLEKINKSLPMLVAKIEQDEMRREPLTRFRRMYMEHTCHCFYCGDRLEARYTHVDHFLPWSYIFEDQAWNMVLACRRCNLKKSASLPQEEFQSELIRRNHRYRGEIRELDHSLRIIDTRLGWRREIQNHYTTCREYGFNVIRLP